MILGVFAFASERKLIIRLLRCTWIFRNYYFVFKSLKQPVKFN